MIGSKETKEMGETKTNIMTMETKLRLEADLVRLEAEHLKAGKRIGEAAGPESDWHDNAAYDEALRQYDLKNSLLSATRQKLRSVEIIKPRQETENVGLGNTVVLRFADMNKDERFTILGSDDSITGKDKQSRWISQETIVAQAIMGLKKGDIAEIDFDHGEKQRVKVKDILVGEFE